ncbi:putative nuclease HARBI1 [Astyanax mexicanus]|uniref:putative nuclease HARBI1 n=1 Tax=Astyanax mexicanus TaxID=7994 RepID=UPI0020CB6186|nr:putative nuclease HARBI1 [Astyanax mexicanus]
MADGKDSEQMQKTFETRSQVSGSRTSSRSSASSAATKSLESRRRHHSLKTLATGTYLHTVGDAEQLSKNNVCREIHKVAVALKQMLDAFVVFPGHLSVQLIKEGFYAIAGFPRVIGAIDCTHGQIRASLGEHEADYINRKSVHSINVQMTCDHQCLITSIDANGLGQFTYIQRVNYSKIMFCFPLKLNLMGCCLETDGYACKRNLMTPFPDPQLGPQSQFNVAHFKTRVRIEMTFGILKSRFNCLRLLRVQPAKACDIIVACVVLHNIAMIRKERVPPVEPQPTDLVDPVTVDQPEGRVVRQTIAEVIFNC